MKKRKKNIGVIVLMLGVAFVALYTRHAILSLPVEPIVVAEPVDMSAPKVDAMRWDIVDAVAECETGGIPEGQRNATIVMDANDKYSLGKWQFQVDTVLYFVGKLYGEDITEDEAVSIAHDEERARQLAYDIIWGEVGGIYHWRNCEKKLNLAPRIETIRELTR